MADSMNVLADIAIDQYKIGMLARGSVPISFSRLKIERPVQRTDLMACATVNHLLPATRSPR